MQYVLPVLALLSLTGCATIDDMRAESPYAVFSSEKAPQTLAECVHDAWQNVTFFGQAYPVSNSKLADRYTVQVSPITPSEMVDITPLGSGSRAEFRRAASYGEMRVRLYRSALEGCL